MSAKTLYKVKSLELVFQIMSSGNEKAKKGLDTDKVHYEDFSHSWRKINFDEYLAKLGITESNWIVTDNKRKISFEKAGFEFEITCAISVPYFRILRKPYIDSKGRKHGEEYVGLNLKYPSIPGNLSPAEQKSEMQRLTHFKMTRKKETI